MWTQAWLAGETANRLFWSMILTVLLFAFSYVFFRLINGWSSGKVFPSRPLTTIWRTLDLPYWDPEFPGQLAIAYVITLFPGLSGLVYMGLLYNISYIIIMGMAAVFATIYYFIWSIPYAIGYSWGYAGALIFSVFPFVWSALDVVNLTPHAVWESFVDLKTQTVILYQALFELDGSSEPSSLWNWLYLWSAYLCVKALDLFYAVVNFSIFTLLRGFLRSIGFVYGYTARMIAGTFSYGLALFGILVLLLLVIQLLRAAHLALKRILPNGYGTVGGFVLWRPVVSLFFVALGACPPIRRLLKQQLLNSVSRPYLFMFVVLAVFKAVKVIVQVFSYYYLTKPAQTPITPVWTPRDVTVIITATGNFGTEFKHCIKSILNNYPAQIIVKMVGSPEEASRAYSVCQQLDPSIYVTGAPTSNKRQDLINLYNQVETGIICLTDDHVFWPSAYLRSSLAEFEDPLVGLVGTVKRVIRDRSGSMIDSFRNYLACIYLERQNFENTASYNIDGGVSVISGITALFPTNIVQSFDFREEFLGQTLAWGTVAPVKADSDNFTTRYVANQGFKTAFRNEKHAVVSTTLGLKDGSAEFSDLLLKWARATWRSNGAALFAERTCWRATPWTTYAIFISSLFNFALIYDPLLACTLYLATGTEYLGIFFFLLFLSKCIKPLTHLKKHPKDIVFLPFGIGFGYYHSWVKTKALFTIFNVAE